MLSRRHLSIGLFASLLLALLAAGGGYMWLQHYLQSPGPLTQPHSVIIAPGSGSGAIATQLAAERVIHHPHAFRLGAIMQQKHRRFQAGEYAFDAATTPQQVMEKLVSGEVVKHKLTIPEGKTSVEVMQMLQQEPKLSGPLPPTPAEGRLLPETYHFTRGESRAAILKRMAATQDTLMQEIWAQRQAGLPVKTPQQAITLASIVEKETALPEERRRVAAVYINRLKRGMKLQADPTVSYGLYGGQTNAPSLTYADLKTDNPYNTYTNHGLPPGPICHPGAASIRAVLNPLKSKELFFVARGDGGHLFAKTYTEHLQNVAQYRRWQRQQRDR